MNILPDGSVEGKTFSGDKYKGEYPSPRRGEETYAQYHARVDEVREAGFHLGDLGFDDYTAYCMGSGRYEGIDENEIIR